MNNEVDKIKKGAAVHHFYLKSKNFYGEPEGYHEDFRTGLRVETLPCALTYAKPCSTPLENVVL
jgi:hypothetical protein